MEFKFITYTKKEIIEAVKRNGDALRYVKEQTEDICIEAVKRNGYALQYVKEQTEDICIEAVKRNGDALRYVEKFYQGVYAVSTVFKTKYLESSKQAQNICPMCGFSIESAGAE